MQNPVLNPSYRPLCTCGTRPGTHLWKRHLLDLFQLDQQARHSKDPALVRNVGALLRAHLEVEMRQHSEPGQSMECQTTNHFGWLSVKPSRGMAVHQAPMRFPTSGKGNLEGGSLL